MGKRTHLVLLVVTSLLAGILGSLVAVAATTETAHACSIAGPAAEVWPSSELRPGQTIEIVGWNFVDVRFHEPRPQPQPQPVPPVEASVAVPPELCDFDTYPIESIDVVWHGNTTERLGRASGPDFKLVATVPREAADGPASISIGSVRLEVHVGPVIKPPPPPCPLTTSTDGAATHLCPDPWPCPQYATGVSGSTQPSPGSGDAPGFLHPCPEPCVDYAHTIDEGTGYGYRWDCTDPCRYSEVNPGAARPDAAIWCPPPPDPCVYYADGVRPGEAAALVGCPDPCGVADAAAIWCPPPPDPCVYYADGVRSGEAAALVGCPDPCGVADAAAIWCPPPPDPCVYYADGVRSGEAAALVGCPDPCGVADAAAIWCPPPPDPCVYYADGVRPADAEELIWCPGPCADSGETRPPEPAQALIFCPDPCRYDATLAASVECPQPIPEPVPLPDPPAETGDTSSGSSDLTTDPGGVAEAALTANPSTDAAVIAPSPAVPAAVSNAVLSITQWVMDLVRNLLGARLG